ncbi:SWIM zinc finger family protein [Halosimplex halophilum]|uniref:SWIM zinc finger family protein n=1 Tax=Halosimplex halophilum TaxID=2559572 RepID=UPI00107FCA15|nr:SWIM zinc finger family protein [Halosimplex halophilum]
MHPLQQLDVSTRVAKRAQYEAFEFSLSPGGITVRNGSHANPSEHEYLVRIEDGIPVVCDCPADEHYEGACKHRVAVAIRRPVLNAAGTADGAQPVAPDGGRVTTQAGEKPDTDPLQDGRDVRDEEECSECIGEFPCWECVRTGRKELPE